MKYLSNYKLFENILENEFVVKNNEFQLFSNNILIAKSGFTIENPDEWFNHKYATLYDVKVIKKFQGKGFSKILLENIFNYIKNELKINTITLNVYKNNYKAINLYSKYGFREHTVYDDSYTLIKTL